MARKRMIDPEFWLDEGLAELSAYSRLLYIGLWGVCDDNYATFPNRPQWIKAQVFPYDEINIKELLAELVKAKKLILFKADDDEEYYFIKNFFKHQKVDHPSQPKYKPYSESPREDYESTRPQYNITQSNISKSKYTEKDKEQAELLLSLIQSNTPTFRNPDINKWADEVRKMRERDKRTETQIDFVIRWCQQDKFWKANILSTHKLRDKFDQLVAKIKSGADVTQRRISDL